MASRVSGLLNTHRLPKLANHNRDVISDPFLSPIRTNPPAPVQSHSVFHLVGLVWVGTFPCSWKFQLALAHSTKPSEW